MQKTVEKESKALEISRMRKTLDGFLLPCLYKLIIIVILLRKILYSFFQVKSRKIATVNHGCYVRKVRTHREYLKNNGQRGKSERLRKNS